MTVLFGKLDYLVLDRWTVSRADALDLPGIERRLVQIVAYGLVQTQRGITDVAVDLRLLDLLRAE